MAVQEIKSKAEFEGLLTSGKVIFVDFYADWCGPCKQISPVFEEIAKEHTQEGAAEFYKIDIDKIPDLAGALGIRSIPTFHVYKNSKGEPFDTIVGANRAKLHTLVKTSLPQA